jgi:acyl-ACP thioesterase
MYSFDSRVRYSEVDEKQQLSITAMVNYLQDCSTFQSEDIGRGLTYLEAQHKAWLLSSWQIVIERLPKLGEKIRVSTWPYEFKAMYGYRNFMIEDSDGVPLVKADAVWFLYDTESGRPLKVQPEDIRGYYTGEHERLVMPEAPRRIRIPETFLTGSPLTVMAHHIDTNHHVNNAKYIEIARESLLQIADCRDEPELRELRVEYKKAAVLGDVMIPHITKEDDIYTVVLSSTEGQPYAVVWMRTAQ